jgi:hypothetical protein
MSALGGESSEIAESPTWAPEVEPAAPVEPRRPAAPAAAIDLSRVSLQWETPGGPAVAERGGGQYGRQPAVKSRYGSTQLPSSDPNRRPTVSEAPATSPTTSEPLAPRTAGQEVPRIDVEVKEVIGPPPGVDASRYRAAEAPASRFSSDSPSAWDEEPKEHD